MENINVNKMNEELMKLKDDMAQIKLIVGEDIEFIKRISKSQQQ